MNQLIRNWLRACEKADNALTAMDAALERAGAAAIPTKLRPATARDIVEGAIIWYPRWRTEDEPDVRAWRMVEEVLRPSDSWKAYNADCGCRYGLDGAFVEGDTAA